MGQHRRIAVVTGGTAGVGRATAQAFARAGYAVALIARGQQGLDDARIELEALGAAVLAISADVADAAAVDRAAEQIEAELGPIDVWINSAMATVFGPVAQLSAEEFRRVTEVSYLGYVYGTQAALRRMTPRGRGTIVQVGSALAYRAIPLQSAYCAAKFAIRGFTDALRCELIHQQSAIRVTMVQLPAHNTPQFDWARSRMPKRFQPVPPIYRPEVAARAILRAAIDAPRELWLGRASFQAILGTTLMPGLLDRLMARRAWDGQMTADAEDPERPDNLFAPVPAPHAVEGRFGEQARTDAFALSSATARMLVAIAIGLVALGGGAVVAWLAS